MDSREGPFEKEDLVVADDAFKLDPKDLEAKVLIPDESTPTADQEKEVRGKKIIFDIPGPEKIKKPRRRITESLKGFFSSKELGYMIDRKHSLLDRNMGKDRAWGGKCMFTLLRKRTVGLLDEIAACAERTKMELPEDLAATLANRAALLGNMSEWKGEFAARAAAAAVPK